MTAKFAVNEQVLINGYKPCAIKTTTVQRKIISVQRRVHSYWYQVAIGTNSKGGITIHTYNEKRIKPLPGAVAKLQPLPCVLSVQSKPIAHWRYCCGR